MTKITQLLSILAVNGLMVVGSAAAQTQDNTPGTGAGQVDAGHPRVNQVNARETNQQNGIANGVKNGQLTPGQTAHLERGEQRLQNNEKKDMAANNGHLGSAPAQPRSQPYEQEDLQRQEFQVVRFGLCFPGFWSRIVDLWACNEQMLYAGTAVLAAAASATMEKVFQAKEI